VDSPLILRSRGAEGRGQRGESDLSCGARGPLSVADPDQSAQRWLGLIDFDFHVD
jgi:hypothetical protein